MEPSRRVCMKSLNSGDFNLDQEDVRGEKVVIYVYVKRREGDHKSFYVFCYHQIEQVTYS